MKLLLIYLLLLVLISSFLLGVDLISGSSFGEALRTQLNAFRVFTAGEQFFLALVLLLPIVPYPLNRISRRIRSRHKR